MARGAGERGFVLIAGNRPVEFGATRTTYGFVARIKKHRAAVGNLAIRILGDQWVDFSLQESIQLDGDRLEQAIEYLRSFVAEGEVTLEAKYVVFRAKRCSITLKTLRLSWHATRFTPSGTAKLSGKMARLAR